MRQDKYKMHYLQYQLNLTTSLFVTYSYAYFIVRLRNLKSHLL